MFSRTTPYSKFFKDLRNVPNLEDHTILLRCSPDLDQRRYNLPSSSPVAAIFSETDNARPDKQCDIRVYAHSNTSYRVKHYYGCYDPLQYPLLFPRGESGWHNGIMKTGPLGHKRKLSDLDDASQAHIRASTDPADIWNLEEEGLSPFFLTTRIFKVFCLPLSLFWCPSPLVAHNSRLFPLPS